MLSNTISLNASTYGNLFTNGTGALYVPVNPSSVLYTQFSYIHGVAASGNQEGVPVSKVRILNTLIEQLVSMKSKNVISKETASQLSDTQMDSYIQQYQKQIQTSVAQTEAGNYGIAGLLPEAGTLFNFTV